MRMNAAQEAALDVAKGELVRRVEAASNPGCKAVNDRDRGSRSVGHGRYFACRAGDKTGGEGKAERH
ncbi:hypothetical protein SAMN04489858_1361 [Paracoccus homiensis]|uniref:Uncharacterized protein n=1 Tax=Paracoccus homiensis TaxID=364199 RepID=A0A1I0JNQ1_9RHOB|nr:hypothetical protein SAMN04489858_1361 [Paracoccus homiensis]